MTRLIGAHVSAGGVGVLELDALGGDCAQVMLGSPQAWRVEYDPAWKTDVPTWVHAPYIANIPSDKENVRTNARQCLYRTIENAHRIGARGLVVHPGTCENLLTEGIDRWVSFAAGLPDKGVPKVKILLENCAGRGLVQEPKGLHRLHRLLEQASGLQGWFGVCVDTQHAWAAGYAPVDFVRQLNEYGLPIDLMHLNGSKVEKGSQRDRHAPPGSEFDTLGLEAVLVAMQAAGSNVPGVWETWDDASIRMTKQAFADMEVKGGD